MPTTLLGELAAANIRFVLVGGLAAVMQGAPITTFDVDISHDREPQNVQRLVEFLTAHDAYYRGRPGDDSMKPEEATLQGPGQDGVADTRGTLEEDAGAIKDAGDQSSFVMPLSMSEVMNEQYEV